MAGHLNATADNCFLGFFFFAVIAHIFAGCSTKNSVLGIGMILGCACELTGYIGRKIWASDDEKGFLIQICCLMLAPALISAAIHSVLADVVTAVSLKSSRGKPASYSALFIPCDIISLTLQGAGVGIVSVAIKKSGDPAVGLYLMVAGLSFQIASIVLFILLVLDYAWRVRRIEKSTAQ